MNNAISRRRRFTAGAAATGLLGGLAAAVLVAPTASANPPCSAGGFAATASSVFGGVSDFFARNPAANDALSLAGTQSAGQAEITVRDYFVANPGQFGELRGIVAPLADQQRDCNVNVSPNQVAQLFAALG